jgi:alpha-L-fucosidase 2
MKTNPKLARREFLGDLCKAAAVVAAGPALTPSARAGDLAASSGPTDISLWYTQPAKRWLQALPVGNGRVGAMVFGGITEEKLALNEVTFWSGCASNQHESPEGLEAFHHIRAHFKSGNCAAAQPLFTKVLGRELNYGTHLPAGELLIAQGGTGGEAESYRRWLDLDQALAVTSFAIAGVHFRREVIASHPTGLVAIRLSADRPGAISFSVKYQGSGFPCAVKTAGNDTLMIRGQAFEKAHSDGKTGVAFACQCRLMSEGGTLTAADKSIQVVGADAATLLIALNTNFGGRDPSSLCAQQIAFGLLRSWPQFRDEHVADHRRLFRRVNLSLGGPAAEPRPTDLRLTALRQGAGDPQLGVLFFQYARYLTIAGSREDSPLPLNLQGIWNDGLAAAMGWTCDYHLDINTQQNYWLSEVGNLSECGEPLFRWVESLQQPGHRTARELYGIDRGWVCHVFSNAWGFTAPGWGMGWGLHVTGGAWIATHLWEHYRFTGDKEFLRTRAYPVAKGLAEFFLGYLFPDPVSGRLLSGPSVSPERGGEDDPGCTHDRSMVWEIFTEAIEGSRILGVDPELRQQVEQARDRLPPFKIGRNGQLQEWFRTDDGGETGHRHTSHLVGLCPLAQITPRGTPDLARAAQKSLQLRTQNPQWEDVEWSAGNSVCYQARLGDGDSAHKHLLNLLASDTDDNLMTFSRGGIAGAAQNIFAIDGNTSGAAGICEMLLQSHTDELELLPALPREWPAGRVSGLRARGNLTVDIEWKDGRVTRYRVASADRRTVTVRVNGKVRRVRCQRL